MVAIADVIGKRLGATKSRIASLQELDEAIDITTDEETSIEEKNILKGIVKFGNISVKQVMRTRLDVSGIEYNFSLHDLLKRWKSFTIHDYQFIKQVLMKWLAFSIQKTCRHICNSRKILTGMFY